MAKKRISKKSFKSLFSRSEANLNDSVEKEKHEERSGVKKFKFFKFKKKTKSEKGDENPVSAAETVGSGGDAKGTNAEDWPDVSYTKTRSLTAPRSKDQKLSYSAMDLRSKPKKFGTFTFGLNRRKKKSDWDVSQSIAHIPEPEVEGQDKEEPLDHRMEDSIQDGNLNKKVKFSMSEPDLNSASDDADMERSAQDQEPLRDSPVTGTTNFQDNTIPLEVRGLPKKAPLALPEVEWDETSQEEDSDGDQCYHPYAKTAHADTFLSTSPHSPSYPTSPLPHSPSTLPPNLTPARPPRIVYPTSQRDDIPDSSLPSSESVERGLSDSTLSVTEHSLTQAVHSVIQTSNNTLSNGKPVADDNISTVTPDSDVSLMALDPNRVSTFIGTGIHVPEVKTFTAVKTKTFNNKHTLNLNNDVPACKTANSDTKMNTLADTIVSVDTSPSATSIPFTNTSTSIPMTQDFTTSDPVTTEGFLNTNLNVKKNKTHPDLSLDNRFDSPTHVLTQPAEQEFAAAMDCINASFSDATQSTALNSATDSTATGVSLNTNHIVPSIDSQQILKDLNDSFFPNDYSQRRLYEITSRVHVPDSITPPPNVDISLKNLSQNDTSNLNMGISITEYLPTASLYFDPLPGAKQIEVDDLDIMYPNSDTDISITDTVSSDPNETFYDCLLPESFPPDEVSNSSCLDLDKPVCVMDTESDWLQHGANSQPNLVFQSEPLTSASPAWFDTEDTKNPDRVLRTYNLMVDRYDDIFSDNLSISPVIINAASSRNENSTSLESTQRELSLVKPVHRNTVDTCPSTTPERINTWSRPKALEKIVEENDEEIWDNVQPCVSDIVREGSNYVCTVSTEKGQEEVNKTVETSSKDYIVLKKEQMSGYAEIIRASSRYATIPGNSFASEVSMSAVHYGILDDYAGEIRVRKVNAQTDKPQRKNETAEVEKETKDLSFRGFQSAQLHAEDNGGEVQKEETQNIESPEDHHGGELVQVEEREARSILLLAKDERKEGPKQALPVQQVHTFMECESAASPSTTEPRGEGEWPLSNWSATARAYIETKSRPETNTPTHSTGQEGFPKEWADQPWSTRNSIHHDTGHTETANTHTTHYALSHQACKDGSILDTHTAETFELVTRSSKDVGSPHTRSTPSYQRVEDDTAVTHSQQSYKKHTLETAREEETAAVTVAHNPQSGWTDCVGSRETDGDNAGPEKVGDPPVAEETTLDRLQKRASGLVTEGTESPGAQPELGQKLPVTADSVHDRLGWLRQPEGYLDASAVLSTASESSEDSGSRIQKIVSDPGPDSMMKSYKSTLIIRPSPVHESKQRFNKVSLVTNNNTTDLCENSTKHSVHTSTKPHNTEADLGLVKPTDKYGDQYDRVRSILEPKGDSLHFATLSDESRESTASEPNSSLSPSLSLYQPGLSSLSSEMSGSPGNGRWLSDKSDFKFSWESSEPGTGADRGRREWEEEPVAAPAGQREREVEQAREEGATESFKFASDPLPLPVSSFSSPGQAIDFTDYSRDCSDDTLTEVFQATRVELSPDTSPTSSPVTSDPGSPYHMEILVDTLKSMNSNPPQRQRSLRGMNNPSIFSLPPIVEDAPCSSPTNSKSHEFPPGSPLEEPNSLYSLPADLGLNWGSPRDKRPPLELMKLQQAQLQDPQAGDHNGNRVGLNLPLRASAMSSILARKSSLGSESSPESVPSSLLNGGNNNHLPNSSRLDNSILFSSYRSGLIDQPQENGKAHSPVWSSQDRMNSEPGTGIASGPGSGFGSGVGTGLDPSRYERFGIHMSGSLTGSNADINSRMSGPPSLPDFSSTIVDLLSPTRASLDIYKSFANANESQSKLSHSSMGSIASVGSLGLGLQRSFSSEGLNSPLFNIGSPPGGSIHGGSIHGGSVHGGSSPSGSIYGGSVHGGSIHGGSVFGGTPFILEPEKNLVPKYRAFPDAYLTKEKKHGKLNPRPGKMFIFDQPGMCGQRIEVRSDVCDATPWELQETISIRVVRGGWVLYEKPNFKGEKIALDEGDVEITYPFINPEQEERAQQQNGENGQNGEKEEEGDVVEAKPARRFIIGSIRRAVRDYSVPEICLFPEENAEGKKVTFRDTSEDARIFGFPIKANSIIINAGLWLVYGEPFFQGPHRVLEVGGYPNPAAWGVEQPYVGSVHPLKIGEPKVEKPAEPKLVMYEKAYFTGKTRTIYTTMRDFMTRTDKKQTAFMYSAGSIKVLGGCWVGYEKEGFRGHQYLLEEGEYHDWRVWGGRDAELRSIRVIRADLTAPMLVMFGQPDNDQEEENTFEVSEAVPDVELFKYRTSTRSIEVIRGAWIAYSHVDFSGDQYILEKGYYRNSADWGACDNRICSVQPILLAPSVNQGSLQCEVLLYTEPDFQGECHVCEEDKESLSDKLVAKSCRVLGGSWVVYEGRQYSGNLYVLSEGDYPNFTSMGCPPNCVIRSLKTVPPVFSVPSISLFGLECFEGREVSVDNEVYNMLEEGYNNHILSVRVNRGCWVLCEHSNYRGRQFLLDPIEITNWTKFSQLVTIGSLYPIKQKRRFFRIRNKERRHFVSIQGGVEELKSGRVVATENVDGMSDIWFYQDGLIKNKLAPTMSLQVMGNVEAGSKLVLWSETRQPVQTWTAQMKGPITSLIFPGMVLDIKGGKQFDRDHIVIQLESEERPCQQWELELL
ncbi:hypothetical protein UPYG_G00340340 [Umbra pygmaea]|uniref:Beta/gamma crystallin 'Greek key' domain-containing protein n=1 Tax=Umbra pygmaea TaxID=75934 RepID=A0ABD0W179_UMBPY